MLFLEAVQYSIVDEQHQPFSGTRLNIEQISTNRFIPTDNAVR